MKAVAQARYGSPDVLELTDLPTPVPRADEVLVEVRAASVNAADWHIMRGEPRLARLDFSTFGLRAPRQRVRGSDFAGVIRSVGSAVTRFRPGDEVFGEGAGTFAEHALAQESATALKPAGVSFEAAASLPMAGTTAVLMLSKAEVRAGCTVLINGASGGVGTFAIQLAAAKGVEVTAVCSARNADQARALGAERVIDYTSEDFAAGSQSYDAVVDLVGNRKLRDLRRVLAPGGTLVLSGGGNSGEGRTVGPLGLMMRAKLTARRGGRRTEIPLARADAKILDELVSLVANGTIRPVIDRTFDLTAAADALRYLEQEHARSKIVLTTSY